MKGKVVKTTCARVETEFWQKECGRKKKWREICKIEGMHIDEFLQSGFPPTRVLLIGDIMLDRYMLGEVRRISPEAPVPILKYQKEIVRPGGAANVALNLKVFGAEVRIVATVGRDVHGEVLCGVLKEEAFDLEGIVALSDRGTTVKTRIMAGGQQLIRVDEEEDSALAPDAEEVLWKKIEALIVDWEPEIILFEDYNKGVLTRDIIRKTLHMAGERGVFTAVDPKLRHFFDYSSVGLVKPNLSEVREALGWACKPEIESLRRCAEALTVRLGCAYCVITLSEQGVYVSGPDGEVLLPTDAREIVDVCGAGDAVLSVVSLAIYHELGIRHVAALANIAGGAVCGVPGVSPVPINSWQREIKAKYGRASD